VAWQDVRGTCRSHGQFAPHMDDSRDGADTIAWLRAQPWCDGTIGTFGKSYLGFTQWASASQAPAGLAAIAPTTTSSDYYRAPWYSDGGALSWLTVWSWGVQKAILEAKTAVDAGDGDAATLQELTRLAADPQLYLNTMPISDQPVLIKHAPWWLDWLRHPQRDQFWQDLAVVDRFDQVTVAALHVGGWFDLFVNNTTRSFTRMRAEAASTQARDGQRLIIGPWDHQYQMGAYHDRQFGLAGDAVTAEITGAHIAFFDRHLRRRTDALDEVAPVRIFVMGVDQWRDEQDWPLPDTHYVPYYLDGNGHAHTAKGDGILTTTPPSAQAANTYQYDPARPVPSLGGRALTLAALNAVGPVDQRLTETRADVLCFTTPVLTQPVEVTGHISLVLHVTSSARDTDFTGKLVDVFPDGRAIYLTDGILRTRYRNSLSEPEFLQPGQPYEITLDLAVTSNVFLPGHHIRLEISSSNFPRYDRNTNTGGIIADETLDHAVIATNQVLHGPNHPSRLVLPIIDR